MTGNDDAKPVVGLVTIAGTSASVLTESKDWVHDGEQWKPLEPGEPISLGRKPRSHGQAKAGRMSRAANQNLDAKIAATEIERASEELELTLTGLGLNARDRKAFDSVRAHLELAKRAVRK